MLNKVYCAFGIVVVACYALTMAMGWEFFAPQRQVLASDARRGAGYLSPGFRGGK